MSPANTLDFRPGARVESSDGKHVGRLHRLIVDHDNWELKELIVEETTLFSGRLFAPGSGLMIADVIVPIAAVAQVTHDLIRLSATAAEVRRMPPYLTYEYAPVQPGDVWRVAAAEVGLVSNWPYSEKAHKTADEIEIQAGENVMIGHTGKVLGRVHDVLYDDGELVGVVIQPHGWLRQDVVLQVRFLDRGDDFALFARISEKDIQALPHFSDGREA